jgi:hypothetical protein
LWRFWEKAEAWGMNASEGERGEANLLAVRDPVTGRFVPGHRNIGGRKPYRSVRETIRELGGQGGRQEKLARLAWEKALAGDLQWAQFVMGAYPREVDVGVDAEVRQLDLRSSMDSQERARLFALAVQVELEEAEGGA